MSSRRSYNSSANDARSSLRHHHPSDDSDLFLPRLQVPELSLNFDDMALDLEMGNHHNNNANTNRRNSLRGTSNISDRFASLRPDRGLRTMASSLRSRRRSLRHEDQAAVLSRLLSVAAAATAASLMGGDHRAVSEARDVAGDGEDGTFESFLRALSNGRIASALRQGGSENGEGAENSVTPGAPLNFFRMFRFGSSTNVNRQDDDGQGSSSRGNNSSTGLGGDTTPSEGRMVPIIIVGIRSINPGGGSDDNNFPPFLDALSNYPALLPSPSDVTIDGSLRQPHNGTRFSHRRRASMGGLRNFPANYDSQRHHRNPERSRPWSTISDTPAPRPPPSTPASAGLSAFSSGSTTPVHNNGQASSSGTPSTAPSRRGSLARRSTGAGLETTAEEPQVQPQTARQRRRLSEGDSSLFGSGSSRRNGVVAPDTPPAEEPASEGSRSWIIYVLGGSYPENHPILTTPSLFTDSPTYEDMLLLSALLGPAKPPVASQSDVESAPGLFNLVVIADSLVAQAQDDDEEILILPEQRCLVCLCDFEKEEVARRLVKCEHMFHKECIDQWLTTGRNSCPLCRGEGVDEKKTDNPDGTESSVPEPTPVA
ncbi:hypothetical protein K402DRAFT_424410 [Aulographum hederae CBS 113979]|uniref:RING-type domain-containing protein n=1 Tax=Aulographum hederae CBS 113979 TaxID=1176131 RepID=A0A6G1GP06_9PEZI|nr:hypothetical protein K402DRAFT_424410 [Aulographum hederae CBS 113979]